MNKILEATLRALQERAMAMDPSDLLDAYDYRMFALKGLRGSNWVATHRACEVLTDVAIKRWNCTPASLCDRGLALGSFTDRAGVTHDWRGREMSKHTYLMVGNPKPDVPRRPINCIECIARFP